MSVDSLARSPLPEHSQHRWGTKEGLSYSALPTRKDLLTYTPMPVPERVSSAHRDATVYEQQRTARDADARDRNFQTKSTIDHDGISLGSGLAFDDDLLRPQTPVSPLPPPPTMTGAQMGTESPVLGRLRWGSALSFLTVIAPDVR